MLPDPSRRALWIAVGVTLPMGVAAALTPWRDQVRGPNVALVLVAAVVVLGTVGGRVAGAVGAVSAAAAFDFFHTRPYEHLSIASGDDVVTTLLLLAIGLLVGTIALRGRSARRLAVARQGEMQRIYRLAARAARGDELADLVIAAQAELATLLGLAMCRFESPPFQGSYERLERSGVLSWREYHMRGEGFELPPDGVELPVMGRGHVLGRFVLVPLPEVGVTLEQRVVAVALADQVGAALAAPGPGRGVEHA